MIIVNILKQSWKKNTSTDSLTLWRVRTKNLPEICPNETSRPWDQQLTTSGCTENSGMIATRRSAHLATGVDLHWIHFKQCNPPIWILLSLIVDGCHFSLAFWIHINSVFWMETILMISITSSMAFGLDESTWHYQVTPKPPFDAFLTGTNGRIANDRVTIHFLDVLHTVQLEG